MPLENTQPFEGQYPLWIVTHFPNKTGFFPPLFFSSSSSPLVSFPTSLIGPKQSYSKHMEVFTIPVLEDNYAYILADKKSGEAALVDPSEPGLVMPVVRKHGLKVVAVLCTSHFGDHAGGNAEIAKELGSGVAVCGFDERVSGINRDPLQHNTKLKVGSLAVRCLHTPFHAASAGAFHVSCWRDRRVELAPSNLPHSVLFSGNALFKGGAGKILEGSTFEQMYHDLIIEIGSLQGDTEIFPGHEYSLPNLEFASSLVGDDVDADPDVARVLRDVIVKRDNFRPVVAQLLEEEYEFNPFLRIHHAALSSQLKANPLAEPSQLLRRLRTKRDEWAERQAPIDAATRVGDEPVIPSLSAAPQVVSSYA